MTVTPDDFGLMTKDLVLMAEDVISKHDDLILIADDPGLISEELIFAVANTALTPEHQFSDSRLESC